MQIGDIVWSVEIDDRNGAVYVGSGRVTGIQRYDSYSNVLILEPSNEESKAVFRKRMNGSYIIVESCAFSSREEALSGFLKFEQDKLEDFESKLLEIKKDVEFYRTRVNNLKKLLGG